MDAATLRHHTLSLQRHCEHAAFDPYFSFLFSVCFFCFFGTDSFSEFVTFEHRREMKKCLGLHFLEPNVGEDIQGFTSALKCEISKSTLDSVVCGKIFFLLGLLLITTTKKNPTTQKKN